MTIYCALCDFEATTVYERDDDKPLVLCGQCSRAFDLGQAHPPLAGQAVEWVVEECSECENTVMPDGLTSTYCGSFCEECLKIHLQECEICARDSYN